MPSPLKALARAAQAVDKTILKTEKPKVINPYHLIVDNPCYPMIDIDPGYVDLNYYYSMYDRPCEPSLGWDHESVESKQSSPVDSSVVYSAVIGQAGSMLWIATRAISMATTNVSDNMTDNVTSMMCGRDDFYNHTADIAEPIIGESRDKIVKEFGMLLPVIEMAVVLGYCLYLKSITKAQVMTLEPEKTQGSFMGRLFSSYQKPSISIEVVSDEELGLVAKKLK